MYKEIRNGMANLKTEFLLKMILNAPLLCLNMYDDECNEGGENRWYLYQSFAVVVVYLDLLLLLTKRKVCFCSRVTESDFIFVTLCKDMFQQIIP